MLYSIAKAALYKAQIYSYYSPVGPHLIVLITKKERKKEKYPQGISALQPHLWNTSGNLLKVEKMRRLAFTSIHFPFRYLSPVRLITIPVWPSPCWLGLCHLFCLEYHQSQPDELLHLPQPRFSLSKVGLGLWVTFSNTQHVKQIIFLTFRVRNSLPHKCVLYPPTEVSSSDGYLSFIRSVILGCCVIIIRVGSLTLGIRLARRFITSN